MTSPVEPRALTAALALLLGAALIAGCGKKGPPQPPKQSAAPMVHAHAPQTHRIG
ncbi:hypothetical protein [Yunchengibacter salinarum]|uniref:hypothetical protein n=1 Tax=Yunchengibacter salinarum TaxID=3133399 RepID=UPI0035B5B33F